MNIIAVINASDWSVEKKTDVVSQITALDRHQVRADGYTLKTSFIWANTPQGHQYWMELDNELLDMGAY